MSNTPRTLSQSEICMVSGGNETLVGLATIVSGITAATTVMVYPDLPFALCTAAGTALGAYAGHLGSSITGVGIGGGIGLYMGWELGIIAMSNPVTPVVAFFVTALGIGHVMLG